MPVSTECWLGHHHDLCGRRDACQCGCHREGRRARTDALAASERLRAETPRAALVVTDDTGRRVCPGCRTLLVKKDPHGPGRYPKLCPSCAKDARHAR